MKPSHRHSLLIIDDHPVYREALGEILTREFSAIGIEVITASNSSEGIELVDESGKFWIRACPEFCVNGADIKYRRDDLRTRW